MTGPQAEGSKRCPDCGAVLPHRDPIVGWWLCDDCVLAVTDDAERIE